MELVLFLVLAGLLPLTEGQSELSIYSVQNFAQNSQPHHCSLHEAGSSNHHCKYYK